MVEVENPAEMEMNEEVMKKKNEEKIKKQQEFEILESENIEEEMKKNSGDRFDFLKWGTLLLVAGLVIALGVLFL